MKILLLTFAFSVFFLFQLTAQVTFNKVPVVSMPSTPQELAKGDFNNDGRIDFVSVNFNGFANQQVTVLLNSGTGTFTGSNKRNFASATNPTDVAVGDFNKDGKLDVVTCSQSNNNFSLLLGDGAGNLAAPVNFAAGNLPQGIAVGDMNKDNNPDVLVTNRGTPDDVYIYLGDGTGNFSAPTILAITNVWDITLADFNGDTNLDFAVYVSNTVQVWFGDGTGTAYSLGPTITSFGISANPITSADLDGDGDVDILASSGYTLNDGSGNFSTRIALAQTGSEYTVADLNKDTHPDIIANDNNQNTPNTRILLGDGAGAFTLLAKFETNGYALGLEVADVNNDSNLDVVGIGAWGGVPFADVLLGDGTGYFTNAPIKYPTVTDPRDLVKGDFNEDGKIDIAISYASNIVSIFLGQGNGRFAKTSTNYTTGALPQYILALDYNKDNHLDLVTLNWTGASVTVFTGAGDGTFNLLSTIPVTALSGSRMTVADFNNDTFIDIAVSGYTNNLISILTGTGSGFNTPTTIPTSENISEIKAADFTGDGNQDIIASFNNINRMVLFTGNGSGGFTEGTTQYLQNGSFFLVDDMNGDNKPDVITFSNSGGDDYFINDGAGNFTGTAMSVTLGGFPYGYDDMDGDGIKDLIVGSQGTNTSSPGQIVVFRGTAGGISNTVLIDKDYSGGNRFVLHDLNGDSKLDIIATSNNLYEDYFGVLINTSGPPPCSPPVISFVTPSSTACLGQPIQLLVSTTGTSPFTYQWKKNSVDISGETSASIELINPTSVDAGTYTCTITNGCGTITSAAITLTLVAKPNAPIATGAGSCTPASVMLTASGGTNGNYRWYEEGFDPDGFPTTDLISGEVNNSFTTPLLNNTTSYYVSIVNGSCESNWVPVIATIGSAACNNQPPVISATQTNIASGGLVTIDLALLVTDADNNVDLNSFEVTNAPTSGAIPNIVNGILTIDYAGNSFVGTDLLTIKVCDLLGACSQQILEIEVTEELAFEIYNAVSPNNDGKNDAFIIANIDKLPETQKNTVYIYNRWGSKVFEVDDYNNSTNVFKGLNDSGNELPSGTYFYKIKFHNTQSTPRKTQGYLVLKR
jgi:gliding motility-associated-like protein